MNLDDEPMLPLTAAVKTLNISEHLPVQNCTAGVTTASISANFEGFAFFVTIPTDSAVEINHIQLSAMEDVVTAAVECRA